MNVQRPLPQVIWERRPVEAQEDSHALDARVAVLEAIVQRLEATVQHLTER